MAPSRHEGAPAIAGELAAPEIDLISLAQVLAVAEHRSFTGASRALGIAQAGISTRVRRLEDLLGVALFERVPRGVRPTLAGAQFIERARCILLQVDSAVAAARQAGRGEAGLLRIGIFTSLASGFLRELIQAFREAHPNVQIDIREGDRRQEFAEVRDHSLDVAFVTGAGEVVGCDTAYLWDERVHVALPTGHWLAERDQLDWADLTGERFLVSEFPPGPEVHHYVVRRAASYSHSPQVERRQVQQEALMNLVGMGFGITVVTEAWTAVSLPGLVMRPLTSAEDVVPFSAIWSAANDNPVLRRFLSLAHVLSGRARKGASDWAMLPASPAGALGGAAVAAGTVS